MPVASVPQSTLPAARPVAAEAAEAASRQTSSPGQSQAQGLNQDPDSNSSDSDSGQQRANQKRARGSQAHASQDKSQASWSSAISASATGAEYLMSSGKPRARSPAGSTPAEIPADTNSLVASQSLKLHPQCCGSPPSAPPIPQVIVQPAEVAPTSTELLPPPSPLALSISPLASPNALPTSLSIASEAALSLSVETLPPPPPPPPLETPEPLEFSPPPLSLPLPLSSPQSSSFWSLFFSLPDLTIHHRPCCLGVLSLSPTAQGPALPLFSSRLLAFCWSSPSSPPQSSPHHHRRRCRRRTMSASTRSQQRASNASDYNSPSTPTKQTFSLADMDASSADYSGPVTRSVARRRTTSRPASSVAPATPSTRNSASTRRHQPQSSTSIPEQSPSSTDSSIDGIDDFDHNDDNNNLGRDNIHDTDDLDTASSNDSPLGSKTNSSLPLKNLSTVDSSSSSAATLQNQQPNNSQANMRHPKKNLPTLLAPPSPSAWNWDLNRCPSPLGLIPIHSQWRAFIHKHEVPRKALHVSIGFFSLWLYISGTQTTSVTPWLMGALIPITVVDVLRHNVPSFNAFYVRVLGALMRESEYSGYNGVIFYLLGAWTALYFFPKDVGLLGVMLLSWCDTAASTFGRLYGRYTPKIRRGKSLAGSLAAMLTGIATALYFWGYLAPRVGFMPGDEHFPFMFTGELHLPAPVTSLLGLMPEQATVSGSAALGIVSVFTGFIASMSEVVDLFGWDDNLTIPVLSSLGVWGFLKIFG